MHTINPRSLENLKLGGESRRQGKIRRTYTLLPETVEWLSQSGNASNSIDQLVKLAKLDFNQSTIALNTFGSDPKSSDEDAIAKQASSLPDSQQSGNRASRRNRKKNRR
jgi:hypothetical protein